MKKEAFMKRFEDRKEAGRMLGERLLGFLDQNPVILAIPRGGLPVAYEVARHLKAPLDVLLVKKIGAPSNPEFAVGAVSEDAKAYFNEEVIRKLSINRKQLQLIARQKTDDIKQQLKTYRGKAAALSIKDRTVIIVDDGIATGSTLVTAIQYLRGKHPRRIVVAAPVAAKNAIKLLHEKADEVVCLYEPEPFTAVGLWYKNFDEVSDDQAAYLLKECSYLQQQNTEELSFRAGDAQLWGDLQTAKEMRGLVIFAHGGGSSRQSPRNQLVAKELNKAGFSTFLIDLLTETEAADPVRILDVPLMAKRLTAATNTVLGHLKNKKLPVAYFGSDSGAEVVLLTASQTEHPIYSIICRGGRMDPSEEFLAKVHAPTLLIIGAADTTAIELNAQAQKKLKNSSLSIIPKATRLFEETGALDKVIELTLDWLVSHLPNERHSYFPQEEVLRELQQHARSVTDSSSWDELIQSLSSRRVVMLGEATHGTQEFYHFRRLISERLIKDHGFNFIAVEGDWPDCMKLNEYIQYGRGRNARDLMMQFHRWPTWMWANEETATLVENLKVNKTGFFGLDVYSLFESMDYVNAYAMRALPNQAAQIRAKYACFDPFDRDEKLYAKSLLEFPEGCRHEVIANLRDLLRLRIDSKTKQSPEYFNAQQNARIVANAEHYYRAMLFGGPPSWNIRDHHMLDTLQQLLHRAGPQSKCIVWAHNSHIGDYHATDMLEAGYVNLGGLARERFGKEKVALVGFGTYQGQVLASSAWEGPETVTTVLPARPSSFEDYCHRAAEGLPSKDFYIVFDKLSENSVLRQRSYGHRAIGVVYNTRAEAKGHNYVPTIPAQRYDAFVFIDRTSYLQSIPTKTTHLDLPETWPGGF